MLAVRARTPLTHSPKVDTSVGTTSDVTEPRRARADASAPSTPRIESPTPFHPQGLRGASFALGAGRPRALLLLTMGALLGAAQGQVTPRPTPRALGGAFDPNSESSLTTMALLVVGGLGAVAAGVGLFFCLRRRLSPEPPAPPAPEPPRPLRAPLEVVVLQPDQTAAIGRPLSAPRPEEAPTSPRAETPPV